jgi:uncharacterized protein
MKALHITENKTFIERRFEQTLLKQIAESNEASIVIVYGRRRVGKTEMLEQTYRNRNILKFEGLENQDDATQQQHVLSELAEYTDEPLLKKIKPDTWRETFKIIAPYIKTGKWTLYFEELQWLANYKTDFVSDLKYAWDNFFRHNKQLILVLCGSSPSFMINTVVKSKALYNRSQYEIPLKPFNLIETQHFLPRQSKREILNAFLTVGGIPEYLKKIRGKTSVFTSLCQNAFTPGAYFAHEYERIFTSSLSDNPAYKSILDFLSKQTHASRDDIAKHLKLKTGGWLTELLDNLFLCGFIQKYTPYNLNEGSLLTRYSISDAYLQFYYKFIKPKKRDIAQGAFQKDPTKALNMSTYQQWLGYALERMCRQYQHVIAQSLGFGGVQYLAGPFYNRATNKADPGYQIDLVFDRADHVFTICECKYTQTPVGTSVINEFETKLSRFPNKQNKTLHKVLIAPAGVEQAVIDRAYFDAVITFDDLFDERNW